MSTSRIFKSRNGYFKTWLVIDVQTTDMGRSVKGLEGGRQASMDYDERSKDVSFDVIRIVLLEKFAKHRINKHDLTPRKRWESI